MKRSIIYAVLAVGMAAVSCNKSGLEAPRQPGEPNETPVTVSLASASALAPVEAYSPVRGTKSAAELPEGTLDGQVHDLWAVQYDDGGKLVGTPYYTTELPAGAAGVAGSGTDYVYSGLSIKLTSSGAASHTVYFIANTHNGTLLTVDNDVATLDKLKTTVQAIGTEYKPTAAGGILMMGSYSGIVASGTPLTGIRLERMAAKIILKYKSALNGFIVTGVQLKNVPAAFGFADAPAEDVNFPAVADGSHIDYPAEDIATGGADGDYKTFVWYVPENLRKATAAVLAVGDRTPDKTDGKATYIEVSGIVREGERCRKATVLILLGDPSLDMGNFQVKRNTIYTVTLDIRGVNEGDNRVTVESYDMNNSAMLRPNGADSVVFDIRKCLNNGFTTQADLNALMTASSALSADVFWQDGNIINTADVKLDKVNGLLTVKSSKTTEGNAVVALYPDANKALGTALWSWHIWVTSYHPDLLEDGTTPLGVGTRAANSSIKVVVGQVHTYGTEFQRANGANKVIMDRNLGAKRTYYGAPLAGDASADRAFGMFYQWGRKDPFPPAQGSTIDANTAAASGIAIYGADGNEVASGNGMRQVPITTAINGTNTLAYAVKNPLSYIYNKTSVPYDWYAADAENQNNELWGDGGMKSAYDPCPKGWRVPPAGTWNDFTRDEYTPANGTFPYYSNGVIGESYGDGDYKMTNGRFYNNMAWYPAPGYRHRVSGSLYNVGRSGFSYSSSADGDTGGLALNFDQQYFVNSDKAIRAHGFQVRCIQE